MSPDTNQEPGRICPHCKQPIRPGELTYTVNTPTGKVDVHAECIEKRNEDNEPESSKQK